MSKRRRIQDEKKNVAAKDLLDTESWPGWCEIESDPAFFNVMLRELGVSGIKIQDIVSLDDETLALLPQPVHALIFLFEFQRNDVEQTEPNTPSPVWFANQLAESSCASIALLNIINNIATLDIGPHLQSFRDFTAEMSPLDRGRATESFVFLKAVHNSFARDLDMQQANLMLKQKHAKITARLRAQQRAEARKKRDAERALQAASDSSRGTTRKRNAVHISDDEDDASQWIEDEEAGYHFIAYIPVDGQVWSLDGMDRYPRHIGSIEEDGDWVQVARQGILDRISGYEDGAVSFALLAAVQDPYKESAQNGSGTIVDPEDGGVTMHGSNEQRLAQEELRHDHELEGRRKDTNKALLRRNDYRAFFTAWTEELKEANALDPLAVYVKTGD